MPRESDQTQWLGVAVAWCVVKSADLLAEAARRRTFAIISHPDAGKTTLTEKFLLNAGAVVTAGSVKAKAGGRSATSDWMELEQTRGISITSAAMQFEYRDHMFNLLDTPGHRTSARTPTACSPPSTPS